MQTDLVSVIMPVYKAEEYIEQAIMSVMQQTYPHIELLCINDGTPDNSFEICKKLSKQFSNIRLIDSVVNRGQEYTRNLGLAEAQGEYITFLDSDDTINPDMIQTLVSAIRTDHADLAMVTYSRITNNGETLILANNMPETTLSVSQFATHFLTDMEFSIICCIGGKLYKTEIIRQKSICFDKKYKYNEDGAFALTYLLNSQSVVYKNLPMYQYTIRQSGSTMSSYQPDRFHSIIQTNELVGDLFRYGGVFEVQQANYYRRMFFVMVDSLSNEVRYSTKANYKKVCKEIQAYDGYHQMFSVLAAAKNLPRRHMLVLRLMKTGLYNILFVMLKLKNR